MLLFLLLLSCNEHYDKNEVYRSENLIIKKLTENTFVHISYLSTKNYGKVPCNGMIFIKDNEAIVFDTPTDDAGSIEWLESEKKAIINGVIVSHFHVDCLGGLNEFHKHNIRSYANYTTIELAKNNGVEIPKISFKSKLDLKVSGKKVMNLYFGEGHTKDNIVSYIPSEEVLFGGCLIKEVGATKGNLNDANTREWSKTVVKIKKEFPKSKYIIPGHGNVGGIELLNYTIKLFENN